MFYIHLLKYLLILDLLKMLNSNIELGKIEWSALDIYDGCDLESSLRAGYLSVFNTMYALRPQVYKIL